MARSDVAQRTDAVRRFNRFYTKQIGLLHEHLLSSPFSLSEARVIYEIAHHEHTTATELCRELDLDAGYLSRLLRGFQKRGLVARRRSQADARAAVLSLTDKGQQAFAGLNAGSQGEVGKMLRALPADAQRRLIDAMQTIERLLAAPAQRRAPYILRPPQPGDMGWVVGRHGALYAQEYGWDQRFEALVAEIVARFVANFDAKCERCWIAEREGENVGCVFCVKKTETVAQLRMLLVEPSARGLGLGTRLVEECVAFARRTGYRKMVLWTNDVLHAARRIYEKVGFKLVHEDTHHSFGHDLVEQDWALSLR